MKIVYNSGTSSSQANGTKSTSFLTRKERSGLSTLGLGRWRNLVYVCFRYISRMDSILLMVENFLDSLVVREIHVRAAPAKEERVFRVG